MKAGMAGERLLGDPAAPGDHCRLAAFVDDAAVSLTNKMRGLRQVPAVRRFVPAQIFPAQHLIMPAAGARHVKATHVRFAVRFFDAALVLQCRGRAEHNSSVPERLRAFDTERNLVAFRAGFERKTINLVEQDDPRRYPPKPGRAVGADEGNARTVAERAFQHPLIAIAGPDVSGDLGQYRCVGQQWQDFRAAEILGIFDARQHHQDRDSDPGGCSSRWRGRGPLCNQFARFSSP